MTRCVGCRLGLAILLLFLSSGAAPAQNERQSAPLTLDEAVSMALRGSDLIRQATEALASQEDAERSARADLFPTVSATYRYSHLKEAPYILFGGQPFEMNAINQYHWDVSLRQPLFAGFALVTRHEMEKLGIDVKGEERRQATLSVVKAVKRGYFNVLLAKQLQRTADEALGQLAAHARDAAHFYQQGLIPFNDVLKSRVALSNARQQAAIAKSRVEIAISALNLLISLPMDRRTRVVDTTAPPRMPAALDPLLAEAVSNRPALQALRLAERQAQLAIRLAKAAYYPDISLLAGYEQNGQNAAASDNDYSNWHNAAISIEARWNFISWGKHHAEVRGRMHKRDAIRAKLHLLEDSVRLEVKQAYLDLTVANENIHTAQATLSQAREGYRITDLRYRENICSSLDVIDARTDLTRAESNYYGALYGYQMAAADLDRAVGRLPSTEPGGRDVQKNPRPAAEPCRKP